MKDTHNKTFVITYDCHFTPGFSLPYNALVMNTSCYTEACTAIKEYHAPEKCSNFTDVTPDGNNIIYTRL
ncbi:MAG: hypothetical protein U9O94_07025 [Nanoarchaeota archaeon]|nr:hypothetical protein [Nanoarchaeota archaeon]